MKPGIHSCVLSFGDISLLHLFYFYTTPVCKRFSCSYIKDVSCVVRCGNGITYYNGWSSLALLFSYFPWSLLPWFGLTQKCQKQFVNFPIKGDYIVVNLDYLQSSAFVSRSKKTTLGKFYVLKTIPTFVFWENSGHHNLLLRLSDLQ